MWPEDMPMPGTRQFSQWFDQQDPDTQNQIIFDFGLSDANQPIAGNDMGEFQPSIGAQGFGMLDQLVSPPVVNSKGVIQPEGTEQKQKQVNLFQDQESLLVDNVLAAIAGQYSPTAFTPTTQPLGNPIQQNGLRQLMSLSQTGGWEGYMAQQMLPTEYGGGGMSGSQAKAALLAEIQAPDSDAVSDEARQLRDELIGSLPMRYETQGTSARPDIKPVNKDITTPQGLANTYDLSQIDMVARQWQQDLAKDPIAAYTDPETGLAYEGMKKVNTPTMDWFDKYGLPYANQRYDDPESLNSFADAVAPWAPGQSQEQEDLRSQDLLAANDRARSGLRGATGQMDVLQQAFDEATKSGVLRPTTQDTTYTMGVPQQPGAVTPTTVQGAARSARGEPRNAPFTTKTIPGVQGNDRFLMDVDAQGNLMRLSGDQTVSSGRGPRVDVGAGLTGQANFDFGAPGNILPDETMQMMKQFIPGAQGTGQNRKVMTAADLGTAQQRLALARQAAAASIPGLQAATRSSDTSRQRQLAMAKLAGIASTGRTPLADTLAGRMMAARTAGVYG